MAISKVDWFVKELLSPKQVAAAIGASESSLKRWCDRGLIPFVLTAGKHRRLPLHGVLSFLRDAKMPLVAPEMLGLPVRTGQGSGVVERSQHLFQQHLTQGDEEGCRRIVFDLYLAGVSLAKICDDVVAVTFQQIGHLWECGQLEIFRERQACEICKHVLLEWRMLLPPVPATQPLAIGGTPAGDPYELPSLMVDLVLKSQGWQTKNLGGNLPFNTLLEALEQLHPALFWLSVSHEHEIQNLEMELTQFLTKIPTDVRVVLGGRGVSAHNLAGWPRLERAQNMQELEKLVNSNPVV